MHGSCITREKAIIHRKRAIILSQIGKHFSRSLCEGVHHSSNALVYSARGFKEGGGGGGGGLHYLSVLVS